MKYFIVGAFPSLHSHIIGGQITACRNLFPVNLYPSTDTFRFDSTQVSNPPPGLVLRLFLSIFKVSSFVFYLLRHQPSNILILFTSGFSIVEKSVFVLIARICSPCSAIVTFPRSDVILTQVKKNILFRKSLFLLFHFSHGIVFQSPSFCNALPYLSAKKSLIVPNSIDSSLCPLAGPRLPSDPNKPFSVLFVGWLEPVKQVDLLLLAIRQFLDKHESPCISVSIVGDGSCRADLESLCSDLELPVTFYGWISDKNVLSLLYSQSSCFCLASKQEGFPNVVLEALIHSLPIISTSVGALPYFFEDNSNILFSDASPTDFCASIEKLYFNKEIRKRLEFNMSSILKNFDPTTVSESVKDFVDSITL